jgi:hypothetical protein
VIEIIQSRLNGSRERREKVRMRRRLSSRGQRAAVLRDGLEEEEGFIGGGGKGYLIAAARAKVCARHGIVDEGRIRLTSQKSRKGEARVEYCMWDSSSSSETARPSDYVQLERRFPASRRGANQRQCKVAAERRHLPCFDELPLELSWIIVEDMLNMSLVAYDSKHINTCVINHFTRDS